ncbi:MULTISPECIES: 30S ribosomal protein THX [Oleiagrimonas]|uniref:30S ribosomal protein THX n=1 Tax=Oleiagrimonas citrea TaxID=1665687 RepID=A0A846ZKL7_9GAMM|nr:MULTISPECIES: 30S ribosomal protein THX [Oleiagrimonas]NKZ38855.1 30S ribosomal protein THX [Oleiagrimonas citrea]RAP59163.1 ribosomal small subunit protein bTHX [Oleiagrimonas sp. MCCC 1A03011]
MGKGDKRTRKGKIYRGSHGNTRPRKGKTTAATAPAPARKATRKKAS